ncbi:uncharacterized protein LOC119604325 [Lucilia sericata]|uniref:uncharacterized protein LOC119604325 n=1 Tax=Lucilia sericata TaxID=13632 RepID=UPI0018A7EDE7|nr:uncharacterized protein LOC119604325 [Lucilia sericata]
MNFKIFTMPLLILVAFNVHQISSELQGENKEAANLRHQFCFPSQTYNIPYPFNCLNYYECINGVLKIKLCPVGFAFDWIKLDCVKKAEAICATFMDKQLN